MITGAVGKRGAKLLYKPRLSPRIGVEVKVFDIESELLSSFSLMSFRLTFNPCHYMVSYYVHISLYNLLNQKKTWKYYTDL